MKKLFSSYLVAMTMVAAPAAYACRVGKDPPSCWTGIHMSSIPGAKCVIGHDPPSCWTGIHNRDLVPLLPMFAPVLPDPLSKDENKALGNIQVAIAKAAKDVGKTVAKAAGDAQKTTEKAVHDVGGAAGAVGRLINREAIDIPQFAGKSIDKIGRGKPIDGLWELVYCPIN